MEPRTLIVTGMHRSGTSLAADLMRRAGVHLGERLLGPAAGNPRGHFEDLDFYALHERCLARQGRDFLLESTAGLGGFDADERAAAARLVAARAGRALWGWKDPRTTLFLADWDRLIPNARYLLLYRHPLEVVLSLLRRGSDLQIAMDPWRGLRSWEAYNDALVRFARVAGTRCLIVHAAGIVADPEAWVAFVADRLELPLAGGAAAAAVVGAELNRRTLAPDVAAAFRALAPSAMALHDELERRAEGPGAAGAAGTPAPAVVAPAPADAPPPHDAAAAFGHLLAALDAPALLASRDALDAFRRATIADLEEAVRRRDAESADLRAESARVAARVATLEGRLAELVQGTRALEEALARQATELASWRRASAVTTAVRRLVRGGRRVWAGQHASRGLPAASRNGAGGGEPTVLFVSHDAHRHGAQLLLLHLLRWIAARTRLRFEIVLGGDGELRADFEALAPTHRWPAALETSRALGTPERVSLVYANTITNGGILHGLAHLPCPVVTHVHELGHWIQHRVDPGELRCVLERTSRYIAVSERVRDTLLATLPLTPEQVELVYEFVGPEALRLPEPAAVRALRASLGIPAEALVVGGAGTMDWRKGPDLFVQLAAAIRRRMPERAVHFVWVGGAATGLPHAQLAHDARLAGVGAAMHLVGSVADPAVYFGLLDAFALVSREDPFPLVALEAAAQGVPIACFLDAGGAPELVRDGCGVAVPYLDVEAMAAELVELLRAPERRRALGTRGAALVRERYTVDVQAPAVMAVIDRVCAGAVPRHAVP